MKCLDMGELLSSLENSWLQIMVGIVFTLNNERLVCDSIQHIKPDRPTNSLVISVNPYKQHLLGYKVTE